MAYGQGNPYAGYMQQPGFAQQMMQSMQPMQMVPPVQQAQQQPAGMACRPVSCIDEVRAWPVDLSGAPLIFYNPQAQRFYTKTLNTMTGSSTVVEFEPVQPKAAASDQTAEMMARLERVEQIIADAQRRGAISASRRGAVEGD